MDTLPPDHADRLARVQLSLDGLSVGDAFGSQFFLAANAKLLFGPKREAPPGPWRYTDDTEQALGLREVLARHGRVEQDDLARVLARRYVKDICRGYGPAAHGMLQSIHDGADWRRAARAAFSGQGTKRLCQNLH